MTHKPRQIFRSKPEHCSIRRQPVPEENKPFIDHTLLGIPELKPGDIFLYGGHDLFSHVTMLITWSRAVHVEVYWEGAYSLASRNGEGVNRYPIRSQGLIAILRPRGELNIAAGRQWWWQKANRRPYGWLDLLQFINIRIRTKGLICSEFAALLFDHLECPLFRPGYDRGAVAPAQFLQTVALDLIWSKK